MKTRLGFLLLTVAAAGAVAAQGGYRERTERFEREPAWEAINNRAKAEPREVRQDFGYSRTAHCGKGPGEMGGFLTPAAEPAFYGMKIEPRTLEQPLEASGLLTSTGREGHLLLGFYNAGTVKEWRTQNTVSLRLSGRGDTFYAWLEYCTSKWRAGGDNPQGFSTGEAGSSRRDMFAVPAKGKVYRWSLRYDPAANGGTGAVFARIGDQEAVCHLDPGHKADGATFNRFGILNIVKSIDGPGEFWFDDVTVNGKAESFDRDPGWEGKGNRAQFKTTNIRPSFDFGFSPTRHAGGQGAGELGGLVFRGDGRYPRNMASYADRLEPGLTLEKPLRASGTLALQRGVSDSTTLLGFFNSRESMAIGPDQVTGFPDRFFGVSVEGPSRDGFMLYPAYRIGGDTHYASSGATDNTVRPDGKPHRWSMEYAPSATGPGKVTVKLDGGTVTLEVPRAHQTAGARYDRFGLITTRVDGNAQRIFFDDLTYTVAQ